MRNVFLLHARLHALLFGWPCSHPTIAEGNPLPPAVPQHMCNMISRRTYMMRVLTC